MEFNATVKLQGKEYTFVGHEEEPLTYILTIDDKTYIQRDIDCDDKHERMRLIRKYTSKLNGVEKEDQMVEQIYHGKEIEDIYFMQTLLENSLIWYLPEVQKKLPTEAEVMTTKNQLQLLDETMWMLVKMDKVGIRRKLVYLRRFIDALSKTQELAQ